jgi:quinoprotein glucose dehydrogenase
MFTPPSAQGTLVMPGSIGGAGWGGGAFDPRTSTLYVKATNSPILYRLFERDSPSDTVDARWMADLPNASLGVRVAPPGVDPATVDPLPLNRPPYGTLAAVDLATGNIRWNVTLGDTPSIRDHPLLRSMTLPPLGVAGAPGPLATAGGLVFVSGGGTTLYAIDSRDGTVRWEAGLGARGYANPMTYRTRSGRQFVVIATGGGADARLKAFALR